MKSFNLNGGIFRNYNSCIPEKRHLGSHSCGIYFFCAYCLIDACFKIFVVLVHLLNRWTLLLYLFVDLSPVSTLSTAPIARRDFLCLEVGIQQ